MDAQAQVSEHPSNIKRVVVLADLISHDRKARTDKAYLDGLHDQGWNYVIVTVFVLHTLPRNLFEIKHIPQHDNPTSLRDIRCNITAAHGLDSSSRLSSTCF